MFMSTTVLQEQVQELKGILIQKKRSLVSILCARQYVKCDFAQWPWFYA